MIKIGFHIYFIIIIIVITLLLPSLL